MTSKDEKVVSLPKGLTHRMLGTDELNICEFPLASAGRDRGDSSNTLFFEDKIFDEGSQQHIERKLIVTASQAFGLPTPADNDVLLVLMYLTFMRNGFAERTVSFSRYELVKLLGWDQGGKSYRRIDESLQRWVNVHSTTSGRGGAKAISRGRTNPFTFWNPSICGAGETTQMIAIQRSHGIQLFLLRSKTAT